MMTAEEPSDEILERIAIGIRTEEIFDRTVAHMTDVLEGAIREHGGNVAREDIVAYLDGYDEKLFGQFSFSLEEISRQELFPLVPNRSGDVSVETQLSVRPEDKELFDRFSFEPAKFEFLTKTRLAIHRARALLYHHMSGKDPVRVVNNVFPYVLHNLFNDLEMSLPEDLSFETEGYTRRDDLEDDITEFLELLAEQERMAGRQNEFGEGIESLATEIEQFEGRIVHELEALGKRTPEDRQAFAHALFGFENGELPPALQRPQG